MKKPGGGEESKPKQITKNQTKIKAKVNVANKRKTVAQINNQNLDFPPKNQHISVNK